jgi:HPt (histidine-containing phosphotransfer) domain-containing protein
MSAHAFKEDEKKCLDTGMDDFISKPIRRHNLLEVVAKWVSQSTDDRLSSNGRQAAHPLSDKDNDTPPMDISTAIDEFGDKEVLMQVVEQLLANVEGQIDIMAQALETNDLKRLQCESHAIKGGAGTIEAHALSSVAAKLEASSRDNNRMAIGQLMNDFRREYDRLKIFIATNR